MHRQTRCNPTCRHHPHHLHHPLPACKAFFATPNRSGLAFDCASLTISIPASAPLISNRHLPGLILLVPPYDACIRQPLFRPTMPAAPCPLDSPALEPPDGVQPDFDHPPNRNAAVHVMVALCLALTTFFLLLRTYTRTICTRQFQVLDGKIPI